MSSIDFDWHEFDPRRQQVMVRALKDGDIADLHPALIPLVGDEKRASEVAGRVEEALRTTGNRLYFVARDGTDSLLGLVGIKPITPNGRRWQMTDPHVFHGGDRGQMIWEALQTHAVTMAKSNLHNGPLGYDNAPRFPR